MSLALERNPSKEALSAALAAAERGKNNEIAGILKAAGAEAPKAPGRDRSIMVDVRVIAATNKDLTQAIAEKSFREGLFYRLNVFPIHIPPLRERREDIFPLAEHFAKKFSARMGRPAPSFSPEARDLLHCHGWPGNVRELSNAVERALIVSDALIVQLEDLPMQLDVERVASPRPGSLADIERAAILESLTRNTGDRRATAEELGISLRTLQYRLKEYGMAGRD